MTTSPPAIAGTYNSRDVGGLRTADGVIRAGVLVRSDVPLAIGEEGRRAVARLGVARGVDLREQVERQLDPPDLFGVAVTHVPILGPEFLVGNDMSLGEIYRAILTTRGDRLARAVRLLAEPVDGATIVFCSAGKDRTGLVTALALAAVGVEEEAIVADYRRTEGNVHGAFRAALEARAAAAGIDEQQIAVKMGAPASLMLWVLEHLRECHGGALGYLEAHGVANADLAALRRRLVMPLPAAA